MLCEASVLLRQVAEPRVVGESVKSAIARTGRALGWRFSRTREVWYGRARRIDAFEMDRLRDAARDIERTAQRLLALRDALAAKDALFHRDDIGALERALRGLGCDAGPADLREDQGARDA